MFTSLSTSHLRRIVSALAVAASAGCMSPDGGTIAPVAQPAAVYNKETGRLDQLVSDRDGDGKADTRASMDGNRL
ncbi:MAG TPA: hypothetical protein VEK56_09120, partial [Vicinamibacterales bacterium]|nr:hypothetical protein [Vicinamibacterales bacterium]